MRIGVDARPLVYPHTGIGRYTSEVIERLLASKHQLCLYTHRPAPQAWLDQAYIVRSGRLRFNALSTGFAQLAFPLWSRIDQIDIFWSPRHHLPLALAWGTTPCAVTIHDLIWKKAPESMRPMARFLEAALMPPSLRAADHILTPSQSTANDLTDMSAHFTQKTSVTPLASHFSPPTTASQPRRGKVLFVGTFEPRKNIGLLIEAFAQCVGEYGLDLTLQIAGQPGWKFDVTSEIESSPAAERIEVHHPTGDEALSELYRKCDFLVLPSWYEGFGLPLVEAMSFGKPVICSDISSMPEIVGSAGLLVEPGCSHALASAIHKLATEDSLYSELSSIAAQRSQAFSWQETARHTLDVLEKTDKHL